MMMMITINTFIIQILLIHCDIVTYAFIIWLQGRNSQPVRCSVFVTHDSKEWTQGQRGLRIGKVYYENACERQEGLKSGLPVRLFL